MAADSIVLQLQKDNLLFSQNILKNIPRHLVLDILNKLDPKLLGLTSESRDKLLVPFLKGPFISSKEEERKALSQLAIQMVPELGQFLKRLHPNLDKTKDPLDRTYVDETGNIYLSDLISAVLGYGFLEDGKIRFRLVNTLLRGDDFLPKYYQKMKLILAFSLFEENDERLNALIIEWANLFPKIHSGEDREEVMKFIFTFPENYPPFKESKAYSKFLAASLTSPTIQPTLQKVSERIKKPIKIETFEDIPVVLHTYKSTRTECYIPMKNMYVRDLADVLESIKAAPISDELRTDLTQYCMKVGKKAIKRGEEEHRKFLGEKEKRDTHEKKSDDPMDYTCDIQ